MELEIVQGLRATGRRGGGAEGQCCCAARGWSDSFLSEITNFVRSKRALIDSVEGEGKKLGLEL